MSYTLLNQFFLPFPETTVDRQYVPAFNRAAESWSSFNEAVDAERQACSADETVKVIYMQRHGHGMHNDIPQPAMPHWSRLLKGNVDRELVDPALSPIGEEQMLHLAVKLRAELEKGLPVPTKVFTSVAVRTCQSAVEVWRNVLEREVPIVAMQDLRDTLCGRGFSRRGPLGVVKRLFPGITIEEGTTEEDDLWLRTGALENLAQLNKRISNVFSTIWNQSESDNCIAIVAHKDVLDSLWTKKFGLEKPDFQTAEMRIVVVKRSKGAREGADVNGSDLYNPCPNIDQTYWISGENVHF